MCLACASISVTRLEFPNWTAPPATADATAAPLFIGVSSTFKPARLKRPALTALRAEVAVSFGGAAILISGVSCAGAAGPNETMRAASQTASRRIDGQLGPSLGCDLRGAEEAAMPTFPRRPLGRSGVDVSALGLGCMAMSSIYAATSADEAESIRTIHRSLELGIDFIDTADAYGGGDNEMLVGRALADRRSRAFVATKFGNLRKPDGTPAGVDGSPAYVRTARSKRPSVRWSSSCGRGKSASSGYRRRRRRRFAARTASIRSRRYRPNIRCGRATSRSTGSWRRRANSGSPSSPTAR